MRRLRSVIGRQANQPIGSKVTTLIAEMGSGSIDPAAPKEKNDRRAGLIGIHFRPVDVDRELRSVRQGLINMIRRLNLRIG